MVTNTICMVKGIRLQNPSPNALRDRRSGGADGQRSGGHNDHRNRDEDEGIGKPALGPGREAQRDTDERALIAFGAGGAGSACTRHRAATT